VPIFVLPNSEGEDDVNRTQAAVDELAWVVQGAGEKVRVWEHELAEEASG
jgi:hypothetical protein